MYKYCIVPRSGVKFWLLSVSGLSGGIAGVGGCEVAQVVAAIIAGSLADGFITSPPASCLLSPVATSSPPSWYRRLITQHANLLSISGSVFAGASSSHWLDKSFWTADNWNKILSLDISVQFTIHFDLELRHHYHPSPSPWCSMIMITLTTPSTPRCTAQWSTINASGISLGCK